MAKGDAAWKGNNCGYGNSTTDTHILQGTMLYHAGTPVVLGGDNEDVEMQLLNRREWVYFSTCKARVEEFDAGCQTFEVSQNMPADYTGVRGGDEHAQDFFNDGTKIAYFSNKECEVVIRSTYLDQYLKHQGPGFFKSIWYALTCCCR